MGAGDTKVYYFFDEAGTPQVLGRHGVNLIEKGTASKTFIVGYVETTNPSECRNQLRQLHERLMNDEYLSGIPSMHSTNNAFHANKDCHEVRAEVFRLIRHLDFKFYCIVARKDETRFRKMFEFKEKKIYKYMVTRLLENKLHLYPSIDLYFSAMGSMVRQDTMQEAVNDAIDTFYQKSNIENSSTIRVLIQQSSNEPMLQLVDYVLWTIQRAYERGEYRYYNFLKDHIEMIYDVFDSRFSQETKKGTIYTPDNPLEAKKIDPV